MKRKAGKQTRGRAVEPTRGGATATHRRHDVRKQSVYLPDEMIRELQRESARQDRPMSWLVQRAWRIARDALRAEPGTEGPSVH